MSIEKTTEMTEFKELVVRRRDKLFPGYMKGSLSQDEHYEFLTLGELFDLWAKGKITDDIFHEIKDSFYFPSQEANITGDLHTRCKLLDKVLAPIR